jgi:uncharacterized protein DUF6869
MDLEELSDAYLRDYKSKKKEDMSSWERVNELIQNNPDEGWAITCLLVNKATSDEALANVAAGPLENLLHVHGLAVIDRVEDESRKNARMRLALSGVWGISPGHPIFKRWYALMQKYGFADGSRRAL